MLIGTIGESVMGEGKVWTLVKTFVIFDVRLSRTVAVELAMGAEQNLDPCLIRKQGTQDHALIPCHK